MITGELADKVAIVTGGAGGLGLATAELFVAQGARVVLADVDEERGEAQAAAALGAAAAFRRTDVADADDVQGLVDFAVGRFGGLHVMFNNAGISSSFRRLLTNDLSRVPPGDGGQRLRRHDRHPVRRPAHGRATEGARSSTPRRWAP